MEKLYDHILNNLEPSYEDHAAQYFFLMEACWKTPKALIFSFADDIGQDGNFAIKMPNRVLTNAELQYRRNELGNRLNSRCRVLLSLAMSAPDSWKTMTHVEIGTVQYCHRSVKDYLTMRSIQGKLTGMLRVPFDPHLRLLSAYLAAWKCSTRPSSKNKTVFDCVLHAAEAATESSKMLIWLLDDLDAALKGHFDLSEGQGSPTVYLSVVHQDTKAHFAPNPWFGGTLLSLTVVFGVMEYVRHKVRLGQGCVVKSPFAFVSEPDYKLDRRLRTYGSSHRWVERHRDIHRMVYTSSLQSRMGEEWQIEWPLLTDALLAVRTPNLAMVSVLLESGADTNLIVRGRIWTMSAWYSVLDQAGKQSTYISGISGRREVSPKKQIWMDTLCLMLQHGYKPDRSQVGFLREFLGDDVIRAQKLCHLGRHREIISKLLAAFS